MKPVDNRTVEALAITDSDANVDAGGNHVVPARTLLRGLRLLELVAEGENVTVTDMARASGLDKGTTSRLLTALRVAGYLIQEPDTKRYRLSGKVLWLAQGYTTALDLQTLVRPYLEDLSQRIGETMQLGILENDQIVCIARAEGNEAIRVVAPVGSTSSVHASAMGRAILSPLSKSERRRLLDRVPLTPLTKHTVTSSTALMKLLDSVSDIGYAVDNEESADHVITIAAAIVSPAEEPIGALCCAGPEFRLADRIDEIGVLCRDTAQKISRDLGNEVRAD